MGKKWVKKTKTTGENKEQTNNFVPLTGRIHLPDGQ